MTLLQVVTQTDKSDGYKLLFSIIGGVWTFATFLIGYNENKLKRRLENVKTIREYNKELREWANKIIDLMSIAGHLCLIDPKKMVIFIRKDMTC